VHPSLFLSRKKKSKAYPKRKALPAEPAFFVNLFLKRLAGCVQQFEPAPVHALFLFLWEKTKQKLCFCWQRKTFSFATKPALKEKTYLYTSAQRGALFLTKTF